MAARLSAFACLCALDLGLAAAEPGNLTIDFDAYYRILRVASVRAAFTETSRSYDLSLVLRTEGPIATLFPWTFRTESRGDLGPPPAHPLMHHSDSLFRGNLWRADLQYDAQGPVRVEVDDPPSRRGEYSEVTVEQRAATVDPLTATIRVLASVAAGTACGTRTSVFDGRLRYDVTYEDLGTVTLEPDDDHVYAGTARLCQSTLHPVAGFAGKPRHNGSIMSTRTWIARPLPDAPLAPVQVEMRGRLGTIWFYARDAHFERGAGTPP